MTRLFARLATAATAALIATPLAAQTPDIVVPPRPLIGFSGGISIPAGGLSKTQQSGFNLGALAEYRAPGEAMGIRGELNFEQFSKKQNATVGSRSATELTVNAIYHVPGYTFRPYVIGGLGFYHLTQQGNHPGFNVGTGIDIPLTGFSAHMEMRVHWAMTDGPSFISIPISFGVEF